MTSCDILRISCRKDLEWLYYSTKFILKFWQTPGRIFIRLDQDCEPIVKDWDFGPKVIYSYIKDPWPDGYTMQMYEKMYADQISDAELIISWDSDLMLFGPASIETLMYEGKAVIEWCDWADSPVAERVWRGPCERVMGMSMDRELMIQCPFLWWRDTYALCRAHIEKVTGKSLYETVYSDVPFRPENFLNHPMKFSEHDCLNLYAIKFQPERYHLRHVKERPANWPFRLYWSHGDWTLGLRVHLESLL
jgi:hypothetical protein